MKTNLHNVLPTPPSKVKWQEDHLDKYEEIIETLLESPISTLSIESSVQYIIESITTAANSTFPVQRKKIKKAPWNPEIRRLAKRSKETDRKWKENGKKMVNQRPHIYYF